MTTNLPGVLAQYLAAASRFDSDAATECFTPDAVVEDRTRKLVGREAIRDWVEEGMAKYHALAVPLRAVWDGVHGHLVARFTGDFPDSPRELDLEFTLRDDRIARLSM